MVWAPSSWPSATTTHWKQVAIKLLRPGTENDENRRFRRERQILADIDHPYIAKRPSTAEPRRTSCPPRHEIR